MGQLQTSEGSDVMFAFCVQLFVRPEQLQGEQPAELKKKNDGRQKVHFSPPTPGCEGERGGERESQ